jgi:hypothetical protein
MATPTGATSKLRRTKARKSTAFRERALKGWRTRRRKLRRGKE